jgi:hypothetical protein
MLPPDECILVSVGAVKANQVLAIRPPVRFRHHLALPQQISPLILGREDTRLTVRLGNDMDVASAFAIGPGEM